MTISSLLALAVALSSSNAPGPGAPRCGFGAPDQRTPGAQSARLPSDCGYFSTTIKPEYSPARLYDIPVVFHVIQNTSGVGFLSAATLQAQIDVLNEDFQALAGSPGAPGHDAKIRFHLATKDPAGNPTTGITYTTNNTWFNDSGSYWNTLAWDTNRYLNIYTNLASGYFGYVPDWPQGGIVGQKLDRVVLWWEAVGKAPTTGWPLNMGRTATHEVGHYFGLDHTFVGGCASVGACYTNGDLICDTNPQSTETFGCPASKTSCSLPSAFHNYMDYSDDPCLWEFTVEQVNRMRCTIQHWRPNLPVDKNTSYGSGCAGSGGFVPTLAVIGSAAPGAQVSLVVDGGLGGAPAFVFVGATTAALPLGAGCTLNVAPVPPVILGPFPLTGVGPGNGALQFFATIPVSAPVVTVTTQAFVGDAGNPLGFCATRGVSIPVE